MPGSMSPTMSLKGDPDGHLKAALKRHSQMALYDTMNSLWTMEPNSPSALMKAYIADATCADYYEIELDDESTWYPGSRSTDGSMPDMTLDDLKGTYDEIPDLEFFTAVFKAMKADEKRRNKRSSYGF